MKLKSYNILFRLFSFFADKTNGASIFVKYKLLLGTLILGVSNASAQSVNRIAKNDTISIVTIEEEIPMITCYEPTVPNQISLIETDKENRKIEGTVKDEQRHLLCGVTVAIEGTNNRTIVDENGKFSLETKIGDTLVFFYLGYQAQKHQVSSDDNYIEIVLKESDMIMCYESVVISY